MPLNYPTTSGVGKIRNFDADSDALYGWVYESVLAEVADIVLDLVSFGVMEGALTLMSDIDTCIIV